MSSFSFKVCIYTWISYFSKLVAILYYFGNRLKTDLIWPLDMSFDYFNMEPKSISYSLTCNLSSRYLETYIHNASHTTTAALWLHKKCDYNILQLRTTTVCCIKNVIIVVQLQAQINVSVSKVWNIWVLKYNEMWFKLAKN